MSTDISFENERNIVQHLLSVPGYEVEQVDVLQKIVRNVGMLLEVRNCSLALLDATNRSLVTVAALHVYGEKLRQTRFALNEGVAGWVGQQRKPLLISDVDHDTRFKRLGHLPVGSILCVPLLSADILLGTLTITSPKKWAFDGEKTRTLVIFAEQVVLTLLMVQQQMRVEQEQMRVKARFLSMMTHELRSPLNTINGYLDLLLAGVGGGELNIQQQEFVQRARSGSEHLFALLEDLFLLSRMDAGQMRLNREVASLSTVIEDALEELELTATDYGIGINVEMAHDFPAIFADIVRLQQVLRNLIGNALKFTSPGGQITISAQVRAMERDEGDKGDVSGGGIMLRVRDTGVGIAPEYHECIFERFFQVPDSGVLRGGGQGLGLTIVKMIVEMHGGSVSVESVAGHGSVFSCFFPDLL